MTPLYSVPRWVIVRLVSRDDRRTDKIPLDPRTFEPGNAHDPNNQMTYELACMMAGTSLRVGFVLTDAPDAARRHWFCLDLDDVRTPTGWAPVVDEWCAALPNTAAEMSQSGRGLHLWGWSATPVPPHRTRSNTPERVELYSRARFIVTGDGTFNGSVEHPCRALATVLAERFPPMPTAAATHGDGSRPGWNGPTDDDELIRRALRSRSAAAAFDSGSRASFAELWDADAQVLARCYPSTTGQPWDGSSADAALAQHLAFWTGCDAERMDLLMRRSALHRDKYEREDYLQRTIAQACARQVDVLVDRPPPPGLTPVPVPVPVPVPDVPDTPDAPTVPGCPLVMTPFTGNSFLSPADQVVFFQGCAYVSDQHRVLVPGGTLVRPEAFKTKYGGSTFVLDAQNSRTTRNAFEALTESQVLRCPRADGVAFRPDLPFGTILEDDGHRRVNIYWPAKPRRLQGDPSMFYDHLRRILPDPHDQNILLYYLANTIQNIGKRPQWMPLLVGVEGNGKSLFSRILAYCVGRRYAHWPAAHTLGNQFNSWLFSNLAYLIEDIAIGDAAETWEIMKPQITGDFVSIEGKGIDQRTSEIFGVFMANTNHEGGIKATKNDRRCAQLWTAQREVEQMVPAGLTPMYFKTTYDWYQRGDGFAVMYDHMLTLKIPVEYGMEWFTGRAPRTSSTGVAVDAGRGRVEQEITEAIEQGEQGFRGGWVSSTMLSRFLERAGLSRAVPPQNRRAMLAALGFVPHPALPDGRTHNQVLPDNNKPRLFVRPNSTNWTITDAAKVAKQYEVDQGVR